MKHKLTSALGQIAVSIVGLSMMLCVLYNYGTTGLPIYNPYYDMGEFSWENIRGSDWKGWMLFIICVMSIAGPWFQYFARVRHEGRCRLTLSGKNDLLSIFFTVFNVALLLGYVFLLVQFGDEDTVRFGYDRLLCIVALESIVYVPWAIIVIIVNLKRHNVDGQNQQKKCRILYWAISGLLFMSLGLYAFDGWYNWRYDFCGGRASQWVDGKCGYINRLHQVVIPHVYDNCGDFSEGLAYVGIDSEEGTRYGCIDRNGNMVIPCMYDWCSAPIYDVIYVKLNGMEACFTKDGEECIPMIYDHIDLFYPENNGLALVISTDERYGFIRRNGDVVIPISYDYCETFFTDGLVRAQVGEKWGYLNHKGDEVIPFVYDEAGIFKDKRSEVKIGAETYLIDTEGRRL